MLVDVLTIVGMLAVMFTLNWSFTLVALAVTPLLAVFVFRLRHLVRASTRDVRRRQSEIVSIVQEGLRPSASSRRSRRAGSSGSGSTPRASRASRRRSMRGASASLLPSVVTGLVAIGTAAVLWFGARLVLEGR